MKILYGVQGTGNGHITRARMMAQALKNHPVSVDYIFSGKDDCFFNMEDFGDYRSYSGLSFVARYGQIEYLKTLRRNNLIQFYRDVNNINVENYDLVLNDFEPITAWAARKKKIPCLGLSHQNAFRYSGVPVRGNNPLAAMLVKWFAPADEYIGFHWHHFNQPILPPMIKIDLDILPPVRNKILVYLPFLQQTHYHRLFNLFPEYTFHQYHQVERPSRHHNVYCRPLSRRDFLQDFRDCAGVITNAGFGACSEAIHYGRKLLVQPLQGQMEQLSNAAALHELGYGTIVEHEIDFDCLQHWLNQTDATPAGYPDVAAEISKWIVNGRKSGLADFSLQLWQSATL